MQGVVVLSGLNCKLLVISHCIDDSFQNLCVLVLRSSTETSLELLMLSFSMGIFFLYSMIECGCTASFSFLIKIFVLWISIAEAWWFASFQKPIAKPFQPPQGYSTLAPYVGSGAPSSMFLGIPPHGSSVFNATSILPYDVPFSGGSAYHYNYGSRISGGSPFQPLHLSAPPPYSSGAIMGNGKFIKDADFAYYLIFSLVLVSNDLCFSTFRPFDCGNIFLKWSCFNSNFVIKSDMFSWNCIYDSAFSFGSRWGIWCAASFSGQIWPGITNGFSNNGMYQFFHFMKSIW